MFIRFGSKSGVGSIMWLGDSRWGRNSGVQRLWWREMAVAVRHGGGARHGRVETLASRLATVHSWVLGSRAGGLNREVGGSEARVGRHGHWYRAGTSCEMGLGVEMRRRK